MLSHGQNDGCSNPRQREQDKSQDPMCVAAIDIAFELGHRVQPIVRPE